MLYLFMKLKLDKDIDVELVLIEYNSGLKDVDVYFSNIIIRIVII